MQSTGGTYEGLSARALVTGEPAEGVELIGEGSAVVATVDAGDGPVVFDVDAALSERVAEIEAARVAARTEGYEVGHTEGLAAGVAEGRERGRAEGLSVVQELREELETAVEDGRKQGYRDGYDYGRERGRKALQIEYELKEARLADREAAVEKWETETVPVLRAEIRAELETTMQADRDAAANDRAEAANDRAEAQRRLDEIPGYDADAAVQDMQAARYEAGWVVKTPKHGPDGSVQKDAAGKTIWVPANEELDPVAERIYNNRKGQGTQDQTVGEAAREDRGPAGSYRERELRARGSHRIRARRTTNPTDG
ncbi:hypothetical protein [Gordonia paraffinivorans]|uniref:hypothetical protein n=1 Tax=Gordonia paraffinivorans TaxID=175628 RepID=UPI001446C269|nr:hypothetical protein [Gordonia paraffinivorans]